MQRALLGEADAALRWEKVKLHFPRIDKQLLANKQQLEATFTAFDGLGTRCGSRLAGKHDHSPPCRLAV